MENACSRLGSTSFLDCRSAVPEAGIAEDRCCFALAPPVSHSRVARPSSMLGATTISLLLSQVVTTAVLSARGLLTSGRLWQVRLFPSFRSVLLFSWSSSMMSSSSSSSSFSSPSTYVDFSPVGGSVYSSTAASWCVLALTLCVRSMSDVDMNTPESDATIVLVPSDGRI
uniref:(northern house mosquito) hypothetical protein n=1 Tax=Culex pipiens TaxID=7175 RepID=A0A8D7ZVW5_CULPI